MRSSQRRHTVDVSNMAELREAMDAAPARSLAEHEIMDRLCPSWKTLEEKRVPDDGTAGASSSTPKASICEFEERKKKFIRRHSDSDAQTQGCKSRTFDSDSSGGKEKKNIPSRFLSGVKSLLRKAVVSSYASRSGRKDAEDDFSLADCHIEHEDGERHYSTEGGIVMY
jgi:hypothetical protein